MSIIQSVKDTGSSASPLSVFGLSLDAVAITGNHKKKADFVEAHPTIEQYLARKVSQKALLSKFNEAYGHTLHPPAFRKLLEEQRKRRAEAGDVVTCTLCGHQLPAAIEVAENAGDTQEQRHAE